MKTLGTITISHEMRVSILLLVFNSKF